MYLAVIPIAPPFLSFPVIDNSTKSSTFLIVSLYVFVAAIIFPQPEPIPPFPLLPTTAKPTFSLSIF